MSDCDLYSTGKNDPAPKCRQIRPSLPEMNNQQGSPLLSAVNFYFRIAMLSNPVNFNLMPIVRDLTTQTGPISG